jgi:hypothetical protein
VGMRVGRVVSGEDATGVMFADIGLRPGRIGLLPHDAVASDDLAHCDAVHCQNPRQPGVLPLLGGDLALRLGGGVLGKQIAEVTDQLVDSFYLARPPLLSGALRDLLELEQIVDATVLRRRPGTVSALRRAGDRVELLLGDRRVALPAHAEPAVRAVLGASTLRPADLADWLDAPGRLVLARRLVREGLLTVARDGHPP